MALKLNTRSIGDAMVVYCDGRIVFGDETALLREKVRALINQSPRIVLDLKGVDYVDSGGLGTLVGLYSTAQNAGGELKLSHLTHRVRDQLQITKLITVFDCHDTEESAIQAFKRRATA
jgi:anti-sigma B factor antagonist